MKKELKRILGASFLTIAFSFIGNTSVWAQTCATPPTCESLGYTLTASQCTGRTVLKCPLDTSKIFCVSAAEAGETTECSNVGDILYSDMTCSTAPISGKVAIGVVASPIRGLAIALEQGLAEWSDDFFDIPNLTNNRGAPTADFSGKSNTKTIVDYCKANNKSCPAAEYAYNYRTVGTETGDWYLPAGGELQSIYNNRVKLNATLQALGKTLLQTYGSSINYTYWSSSENDNSTVWSLYFPNGGWRYYGKTITSSVRPVLAF